jgi:tRNA dimethylallyltransferase
MENKRLVVIEGPTASGKTNVAVELGTKWKTVVVSADSRQFYKQLSIGTAKPSPAEMKDVPHFFIDSHSVEEEISAGKFAELAKEVLEEQFKQHDTIVLVGGSGMFIDALCMGLHPVPSDLGLRNELTLQVKQNGLVQLLIELEKKDPETYRSIDRNNPVRVVRAVEAVRLLGQPLKMIKERNRPVLPFSIHRYVLNHPREVLYERINERVELMMNDGLWSEVQSVYKYRHLQCLKTVGYTELFDVIEGKTNMEKAVLLIQQHTRNYAKRQLTWFRRHHEATWIAMETVLEPANWIARDLEKKYGT